MQVHTSHLLHLTILVLNALTLGWMSDTIQTMNLRFKKAVYHLSKLIGAVEN